MSKLSITKVEKALREHHGVILRAAEACGVARMTLYKFIEANPSLQEVRAEMDEELLDVAESAITTALKASDMKTVRWYAERKGKNRGYTTRQEMTGADGGPLETQTIERRIVDPEGEE